MRFKKIQRVGALACCLFTSGCSLFDPYVNVEDVHVLQVLPAPPAGATSDWAMSQTLLRAELRSAQAQADAYRLVVKYQARLKTGLAAGVVPLGAFAVVDGALVHHGNTAAIAGGTAAAALGLGGLLSSPSRQTIYLQAQTATLCTMAAYDIYLIKEDDYQTHLVNDVRTLQADLMAVAGFQADLNSAQAAYDKIATADEAKANADAAAAKQKAQKGATAKVKKTPALKAAPVGSAGGPAHGAVATAGATEPAKSSPPGAHKATSPASPSQQPVPPPRKAAPAPPPLPKAPAAAGAAAPTPSPASVAIEARASAVDTLVEALISRANSDLSAANATEASLEGVRERVDSAGRSLGDRRMAIKAQVDQSVEATELTVDQIKSAISASALSSTQASPAAPKTASTAGAKAQAALDPDVSSELQVRGSMVNTAMVNLTQALEALERHKASADPWLQEELQREQNATQVGSCASSAQAVLTATPDNPSEISATKSLKVLVHAPDTGGAPTTSKLEDGLSSTMTTSGGYTYTLTISEVSGTKPASTSQTLVVSSGSQSVKVAITVTDATDAKTKGASAEVPPPPPSGLNTISPSIKPAPQTPGANS